MNLDLQTGANEAQYVMCKQKRNADLRSLRIVSGRMPDLRGGTFLIGKSRDPIARELHQQPHPVTGAALAGNVR